MVHGDHQQIVLVSYLYQQGPEEWSVREVKGESHFLFGKAQCFSFALTLRPRLEIKDGEGEGELLTNGLYGVAISIGKRGA